MSTAGGTTLKACPVPSDVTTPLERPPGMADKEFLTEEVAVELEWSGLDNYSVGYQTNSEASDELNEVWLDTRNGRSSRSGVRRSCRPLRRENPTCRHRAEAVGQ